MRRSKTEEGCNLIRAVGQQWGCFLDQMKAYFIDISQRRQQVESTTRLRVVYGESIIYAYSKIVMDSTDNPIGEVKILLDREK